MFRWAKAYRYCLPEAMVLRGRYEWIRGKSSSAQEWWKKSIKAAEEMGMRYDLAMTHLEMGRRLNDREHLKHAEAMFGEIGAVFDLAQARELLERLQT